MDKVVRFYDKTNIDDFIWPSNVDGIYAKNYLYPMIKDGVEKYISNIKTKLAIISIGDIVLPITINDAEYDNSYVCSIYSHYVSYAIEELRELKNRFLEGFLKIIIMLYGTFIKLTLVNKVIIVNNWMLSTNLYVNLSNEDIDLITKFILKKFPNHAIIFRSLNECSCINILKEMNDNSYNLIPSRQVYFFDKYNLASRPKYSINKDKKLIDKNGYKIRYSKSIEKTNFNRYVELYNKLYIDKYSELNPQFTSEFMRLAISNKVLNVIELLKGDDIIGVMGYFVRNNVMTTPLFGYDTSIDINKGLYRVLSVVLMDESLKNGFLLHQSSGAANFKKSRGSVPYIEYIAVYTKHLGLFRKLPWVLLDFICNYLGKFILKFFKL